MLREMVSIAAFLFVLSGIAAGVVIVQKNAGVQTAKAEQIMEAANEID